MRPPNMRRRLLRIGHAHEPALVQALIPELPVEALDERVLNRIPRLDELEFHLVRVRPLIERYAHSDNTRRRQRGM